MGGVVACGGVTCFVGSGEGAVGCEEAPDVIVGVLGFGMSSALVGLVWSRLALAPLFVFGFGACASFFGELMGCVVESDLFVGG